MPQHRYGSANLPGSDSWCFSKRSIPQTLGGCQAYTRRRITLFCALDSRSVLGAKRSMKNTDTLSAQDRYEQEQAEYEWWFADDPQGANDDGSLVGILIVVFVLSTLLLHLF